MSEITPPPIYATPNGQESVRRANIEAVGFNLEKFQEFHEALGPIAPVSWHDHSIIIAAPTTRDIEGSPTIDRIAREKLTPISGAAAPPQPSEMRYAIPATISEIVTNDPSLTGMLAYTAAYPYKLSNLRRGTKACALGLGGVVVSAAASTTLLNEGHPNVGAAIGAVGSAIFIAYGGIKGYIMPAVQTARQVAPFMHEAAKVTGLFTFERTAS